MFGIIFTALNADVMVKSPKFIDPALQAQYDDWGYVHIKGLLNQDEIAELNRLFRLHYCYNNPESFLWNSLCDIPHDKSAVLSDQILNIVKPKLDKYMSEYVCPAATFLVKNPTPNSTINLHRDFSVQEEDQFSYQNIWLPIVDTTPQNGRLFVMKRIHKLFDYPLPHFTRWPYKDYESLLLEYCDEIEANAGDLIVYGDKVLHGSSDNVTPEPRPVVHFGLLHPEAKLCYYYYNEAASEATVYEVPYPFFFENAWGNQDGRFPIIKKFHYNPPKFTETEIREWIEKNIVAADAEVTA